MITLEQILQDFDRANESLHMRCARELQDGECDCPVSWNRRCLARAYEAGEKECIDKVERMDVKITIYSAVEEHVARFAKELSERIKSQVLTNLHSPTN